MNPTRTARKVDKASIGQLLSMTVAVSLAIFFPVRTQASDTLPVLDLTARNPHAAESMGVPGMSVGGVIGYDVPRHSEYSLPLEASFGAVNPSSLEAGQKFVVEVTLRNSGTVPFYLPVSRDSMKAHKPGNKDRRSFDFRVKFVTSDEREAITGTMAVTQGSPSSAESLWRLGPQQSVLVRFEGDLKSIHQWVAVGVKQVQLRFVCSEYTLEDNRYTIKQRSKEIQSQNSIGITIEP